MNRMVHVTSNVYSLDSLQVRPLTPELTTFSRERETKGVLSVPKTITKKWTFDGQILPSKPLIKSKSNGHLPTTRINPLTYDSKPLTKDTTNDEGERSNTSSTNVLSEETLRLNQHVAPIAFPMFEVDRYGFLASDKRFKRVSNDAQAIWLENRRTQKWVQMIGTQLEDWEICQLRHAKKLKKRIRKGIPEALRGRVWCYLAGSTHMLMNNPGVFREFLQTTRVPCEETIIRDIGRTFPKHYLFHERTSLGQCALLNVLKAYSLHDPEVGYCQGMGFLTAMFLSYMPEEQSFWHVVACLNHKRYDLAGLYRPRMPKVPEVTYIFEQLLKQLMPTLSKHLQAEGMHSSMYLTQWFITLFTYNFPFAFVTRVWDVYLNEGWKVIFRIALALMKTSQKILLANNFEGMMEYFRELPTLVNTDEVFPIAFKFSIKRAQINALQEEYQKSISVNN